MNHAATVDPSIGVLGIHHRKLGVWLFLASEVMFFTGLIGAYIVLRFGSPDWPVPSTILNIPLTALNTFILICSSVTMVLALAAVQRGEQRKLKQLLLATVLLGVVFLGIQGYEYSQLGHHGLTLSGSLFGSCFYVLTGFHGFHVLAGVVCIAFTTNRAFRGWYTQDRHIGVETIGLYWHFVDLVWIILFTIVYLI